MCTLNWSRRSRKIPRSVACPHKAKLLYVTIITLKDDEYLLGKMFYFSKYFLNILFNGGTSLATKMLHE